jgi:hypothetical protein
MPIDKTTALAQIDAVSVRRKELGQNWVPENVQDITTLTCAAIKRLAPPGSSYLEQMESVLKNTQKSISRSRDEEVEFRLRGVLSALRADYQMMPDACKALKNLSMLTSSPTSLRWPNTSWMKATKIRQPS